MIIIWAQSSSPSQTAYGSDLSADDLQFEKEYWKPRTTFRYAVFHIASPSFEVLIVVQLYNYAGL